MLGAGSRWNTRLLGIFCGLFLIGCDDSRFQVPVDSQELPKDVMTRYLAEELWRPKPKAKKAKTQPPFSNKAKNPTSQPIATSRPVALTRPTSRPSSQATTVGARPAPFARLIRDLDKAFAGIPRRVSVEDLPQFQRRSFHLEPDFGHGDRVLAMAVSPTGTEVLTGGMGRVILRWSLRQRRRIQTLRGFGAPLHSISFSPDGRRFAALEGERTVSIWSRAGKLLRRWSLGTLRARSLRFVPVEDQLLILSKDGAFTLWQVGAGRLLWSERPCPKGATAQDWAVQSMQRWWAVGCSDGHVWRRAWETGKPVLTKLSSAVTAVAIDENGERLAVATQDTKIHVWDIDPQGALRFLAASYGHLRSITHLRFLEEGRRLLSGSEDSLVGVWQIRARKLGLQHLLQHSDAIKGLHYHRTRKEIVSLDGRGFLRVWSLSGEPYFVSKKPPAGGRSVVFSPNGHYLLSDAEKGTAAMWTLENGRRQMALTGLPLHLFQVIYAQDGNHIITADPYNLLFWDIRARRQIDVVRAPKDDEISAVTRGYDWAQAFYGTTKSGVFLWTIAGQRLLYRHSAPKQVSAVDLHVASRFGAAGTSQGKLYLYNLGQYQVAQVLDLPEGAISTTRFSPDGKRLLVTSGHTAILFAVPSLKRLQQRSFKANLSAATFLPKGDRIALGRVDAQVLLWTPGQKPLKAWTACDATVSALAPAPKKPFLAVACRDGSLRLWSLKTSKLRWTAWPLPDKDWLALGAKGEIAASRGAGGYFFFSNQQKLLTLDSFDGAWMDANALHRSMKQLFPPLPKLARPTRPKSTR